MVVLQKLFSITYGVNLELCNLKIADEGIRYVSRTYKNNGISAIVERVKGLKPNPANTISVALTGSVLSAFLQEEEYYSGRDIAFLTPLVKMTKTQMIQYCKCIGANKDRYAYGRGANRTLKDILVPELDELPSMDENYDKYIDNIPDYFLDEGFEKACWYIDNVDQEIFEEEYQPSYINNDKCSLEVNKWEEFNLGDTNYFRIERGNSVYLKNLLNGEYPYVSTKQDNNGIAGFKESYNRDGNLITLAYDGSVGEAFYQRDPFFASEKIVTIDIVDYEMNIFIAMFLITILKQERFRYDFGKKWTVDTHLKKTTIKLPVNSVGSPDWEFMERYIKTLNFTKSIPL